MGPGQRLRMRRQAAVQGFGVGPRPGSPGPACLTTVEPCAECVPKHKDISAAAKAVASHSLCAQKIRRVVARGAIRIYRVRKFDCLSHGPKTIFVRIAYRCEF